MERADQLIKGIRRILLGHVGEVGVERGGGGAAMAEECLDMAQAQTLLKQMGGQAVSQ